MLLTPQKRKAVLRALELAYPDARPALEYTTAYELLTATMLSAQCTDKQVNKVTRVLFPIANTPEKMAALSPEELFPIIHSCGFFNTKGRHILETAELLCLQYGGEVPRDRDALTKLPGVGRKTANVVLSNAFGIPAIAVDTHVFRVSNRIGLAEASTVEKTEEQLMKHIPKADWGKAHHWLIYHGRQVCAAQRPKCELCCVKQWCSAYNSPSLDKKAPPARSKDAAPGEG